eukprot:7078038-Alexandrium_andersonii.AAC.1
MILLLTSCRVVLRAAPPMGPNCYTDGSLMAWDSLGCAFAGFAVWCPGEGDSPHAPWSGPFADFVYDERAESGWAMWSHITGRRPSSTRAEIAALLAAMFVHKPVRAASDSSAAVNVLGRLLASKLRLDLRPWGMRANGDLWVLIQRALEGR